MVVVDAAAVVPTEEVEEVEEVVAVVAGGGGVAEVGDEQAAIITIRPPARTRNLTRRADARLPGQRAR